MLKEMPKDIQNIQAIDVHSHYGPYLHAQNELVKKLMSGTVEDILKYNKTANIKYSIVSPMRAMTPRGGGDPVPANEDAAKVIAGTKGLFQWVVIDPLKPETFKQAERMLQLPKCIGIKIHPEEHLYPIKEYGKKIFEFAARYKTVVETHSGEQNSLPMDYVEFADEYPEVTLILSHLGCGWDNDLSHQVRAIQKSKHGNIYTDCSSANSIIPNLIEWAVEETGSRKIFFGTDTPVYFAPMIRARIDHAYINYEDKLNILYRNVQRIFGDILRCND